VTRRQALEWLDVRGPTARGNQRNGVKMLPKNSLQGKSEIGGKPRPVPVLRKERRGPAPGLGVECTAGSMAGVPGTLAKNGKTAGKGG